MEKDLKRDQIMENNIIKFVKKCHTRLFSKCKFMGVVCANPYEFMFEALCNEEVKFQANKGMVIIHTTLGRVATKVEIRMKV